MDKTAELIIEGKSHQLPVVEGTEQERGIDISSLRNATGLITLDDGYANTGSCQSQVTFIDGEKGILRYRGIPIEELAEKIRNMTKWDVLPIGNEAYNRLQAKMGSVNNLLGWGHARVIENMLAKRRMPRRPSPINSAIKALFCER